MFTVTSTVHIRHENATSFPGSSLLLGPWERGCTKTELFENQTGGIWKPRFCVVNLVYIENILENGTFRKQRVFRVFLNCHKSKMTGDCCVLKFARCCVDGKHLMHFQSVFIYLQRCVNEAYYMHLEVHKTVK